MDETRLHALLTRLHEQLRSVDAGDPGTRQVVDSVGASIRPMMIGGPGPKPPGEYAGLTGKLKEAAVHFEASHPDLARSIEAVVDSLGSYGI